RLAIGATAQGPPQPSGQLWIDAPRQGRQCKVAYGLSSAWKFVPWQPDWIELAETLRHERWLMLGNDDRRVLYGRPMLQALVHIGRAVRQEQQTVLGAAAPTIMPAETLARTDNERQHFLEPGGSPSDRQHAAVCEIHARWLMTPREELQGRTPRQVLVEQLADREADMEDRREQGNCHYQCHQHGGRDYLL